MDLKALIHSHVFVRVPIGLVVLALVISSCKSARTGLETTGLEDLPAKTIISNHYDNLPGFTTLSGKVKIAYKNGDAMQSFAVSLRMKKDEAIWISAPLGVLKAYITPERVSFYNKLQNEYFDGDFSYLSELLGTDLDFHGIQNLLLGQALLDLRDQRYQASANGEYYELKPRRSSELLKTLFAVNPQNFKMARQQLSQPMKKRLLEIRYLTYQQNGDYTIPSEIGIMAIASQERTFIDLDFRNMEFNRNLNFPYKIPKGYEEIIVK